jgi:hypothetical protein
MAQFSLQTQSALFKTKFGKLSENAYNSANVMLGTIKKNYNFTGEDMKVATPTFFSGGVGSGSLPTPNPASAVKATLIAKRTYSTTQVQREAIKASASDEGAFVEALKWNVQKTVEAYNRNASRILFGDGSGALGTTTAVAAGGSAAVPVITITQAAWVEGHWEENDYVNVESNVPGIPFGGIATDANTPEQWVITEVNPTLRQVTLGAIGGITDLTAGVNGVSKIVYMQNSTNTDPQGLKGVCDAVAGTLYGVTVQRRWQATQINATGSGISSDLLNELILKVQYKCGKTPKKLMTSYTQYRKILNFLEDHKVYMVDPRASELKGKISFKGIEYLSDAGPIGIFADKMCDDDRLYAVNDDFIEAHHRPDFGWFDDDGTVFLRLQSQDSYGARYGGYLENYIIPTFQGVITGLAI